MEELELPILGEWEYEHTLSDSTLREVQAVLRSASRARSQIQEKKAS